MSTTQATSTPDLEDSELTTTSTAETDGEIEAPNFPALLCPRDGTNLEDAHRPEPGRFECPKCRRVWPAWEVVE
jgi:hypothetical protein